MRVPGNQKSFISSNVINLAVSDAKNCSPTLKEGAVFFGDFCGRLTNYKYCNLIPTLIPGTFPGQNNLQQETLYI
jgi:hypothetical protein